MISVAFMTCLAFIAFCYAAVGHGGASGYIAVFALFGMLSSDMKSLVLIMNLGVASLSFFHYYKHKHFNFKYFLPFGLGAAPMAYFGASLKLDAHVYQYLLATFLIFSVFYLMGMFNQYHDKFKIVFSVWKAFLIALVLGFLSGVIGVGGGIFLSPILLILGWLSLKQTAAISSLFIVINSLAGLIALNKFDLLLHQEMLNKLLLVLVFGYLGGKWGVLIQNQKVLKRMLAFVLFIAAVKLCVI